MRYLARTVDTELDELLDMAPAVAIDGPKGVGKTATAERRASTAWYLDDSDQRGVVEASQGQINGPPGTLLIDEWQRLPAVWDAVRRSVDRGAPAGRFLLTGSASPAAGVDTHSGAARVLSVRMRPMALYERGVTTPSVSVRALLDGSSEIHGRTAFGVPDYIAEMTASGLPGIRRQHPRLIRRFLDAYLQRVIDRDLPDHGVAVRRPETLRRWMAAYAAASSTTTAYSRILDATTGGDGGQPAKTTTIAYRDHLTQLWLLDPLPAWTSRHSAFARLKQAPKHQLADPALAARLLNLSAQSLASPRGASMTGPLFESLATLTVRVAAQAIEASVGHLRTRNGDHEVDLVVEGPDGEIVGVEVKLAASVEDADLRHLHWLRKQLGDDVIDLVVITTGAHAYRRSDGVAVVPLALLGA